MKIRLPRRIAALCFVVQSAAFAAPPPTTSGAIAIANLDHQLAQAREPASRIELLLARSRFLADYDALEEAVALAESLPADAHGLLLRALVRAAAHRFDAALDDLATARRARADTRQVDAQRASILIATGHADEALPLLQEAAAAQPGYASHSALANACAALGRYAEADRHYALALEDLHTTSPFPYAWIHFARGFMWSEQAGDPVRGEAEYARALAYLPEFAVATVHKAELELGRGDVAPAATRLARIAEASGEPEALALLGTLRIRAGDAAAGRRFIDLAGRRYARLLHNQPLAFADHAAAFYLGPGADLERAWHWAARNLANRETPRAWAIASDAAVASGRDICAIARRKSAGHFRRSAPEYCVWSPDYGD